MFKLRIVANSTPLIYLAKIGRLDLLWSVFNYIVIPNAVYTEVVEVGLEKGYHDAELVKRAVDKQLIRVEEADNEIMEKLQRLYGVELDQGEVEVLALALTKNIEHVLVDDKPARTIAYILGLRPHGTLYVLFRALRLGIIDLEEALSLLDRLVEAGLRVSIEVYVRARRRLEEISSKKS